MGAVVSKCYTTHEKNTELRARIHVLEGERKELQHAREREARAYEQHVLLFACREEEWKQERKKHREEAERLRRRLVEEEDRVRSLEGEVAAGRGGKEWQWMGTEFIVEQLEEQARREVAVEKWKQLYLAIKTELDDLIQRTRQGGRFFWAAEEGVIEGFHQELKEKEEIIETLRSRISGMEKEGLRREREIDILKQSLRILSNTKRNRTRRNLPRGLRCE